MPLAPTSEWKLHGTAFIADQSVTFTGPGGGKYSGVTIPITGLTAGEEYPLKASFAGSAHVSIGTTPGADDVLATVNVGDEGGDRAWRFTAPAATVYVRFERSWKVQTTVSNISVGEVAGRPMAWTVEAGPFSIRTNAPGLIYQEDKADAELQFKAGGPDGTVVDGLRSGVAYKALATAGEFTNVVTQETASGGLWSLDKFPEFKITSIRHKEVLAEGRDTLHLYRAKGLHSYDLKAATSGNAPTVDADGMHFRVGGDGRDWLRYRGTSRNPAMIRCAMVVFKVSSATGRTTFFNVAGTDNMNNQPGAFYKDGVFYGRWSMPVAKPDRSGNTSVHVDVGCPGVVLDKWNVGIVGTRDGKMYARLNGKPHTTHTNPELRYTAPRNENDWVFGSIDARQGDNLDFTAERFEFIQGELSEKWVRKLEATVAKEVGAPLPDDHPYKSAQPLVEADDSYHQYRFDAQATIKWKAENPTNANKFFVNRGKPAKALVDYKTVFFDDFRRNTVGSSVGDAPWHCNYFGPGHNPAVGGDNQNGNPYMPDPIGGGSYYEHDAERGYFKLIQAWDGNKWNSPAIYTINDTGHGRAYGGGYRKATRFKFDKIDDTRATGGELFWADWMYNLNSRIWHHTNRLEFDLFEAHAPGQIYMNGSIMLWHEALFNGYNPDPSANQKLIAGDTSLSRGWPFQVKWWTGEWMVIERVVEPDWTYVNIDLSGNPDPHDRSKLVELYRFPTPRELLEEWYFIHNTCIKNKGSEPWQPAKETQQLDAEGNRLFAADGTPLMERAKYRYWLDWDIVEQRSEIVERVPVPFNGRPSIVRSGNVLTINAPLSAPVEHMEVLWHADGYPLINAPSLDTTGVKGKVRALVKAAGYTDRPEAWSTELAL